ncbi:MAG TPA: hypothetical protein VM285_08305 [Polyangia bacterium]|nr:hypothetical protein [Polyangia bacterium]
MRWGWALVMAWCALALREWRWFVYPVVITLCVLAIAIFMAGCATATRWVPCPDGLTVDVHATRGRYDGSDLARALGGETDGFDSNYEAIEFGGAMHFALGAEPARCRTWGGDDAD